jgi:nucleoside-diphosphate-sugar epimerase
MAPYTPPIACSGDGRNMAKKILVTGGTGFTGGHLCERLIKEGHQVRTIARKPEKAAHLARIGVEILCGDIVEFQAALKALANVDTVYHIAALYRQEGVPRKLFWDVNVTGTENLIKASLSTGVTRFVHCSTVGVHGAIEGPAAGEDTPYRPGDHYQKSKVEGEKLVRSYMSSSHMGVTVFRPAPIYGPGDLRFLKLFKAIQKNRFWMIGTGNVFYHLTYIDDLIEGILLCGSKIDAIGKTYIIAGNEFVTLNALVSLISNVLAVPPPRRHVPLWPIYAAAYACETICKPLGIEPPLYRRRVDFFRKSRAFDITKAMKELQYQPKIDLQSGLQKTANWYREQGYL